MKSCNQEVFDKGVSLGFVDMAKEEAEAYCKAETKRTGNLHDWHYAGGRVHIMMLEKAKTPQNLKKEIHRTIEEINAYQSLLIWLAASVLIVGAVALNLLRYIVVWPRVVYKRWRKSTK